MTTGPLSGIRVLDMTSVVLGPVRQVLLGDTTNERVSRIAVRQQRTDGQQNFGNGQRWRPIVFEYV